MKKIFYLLLCVFILCGCRVNHLSYDDIYQKLIDSHVEIALVPIDTPHVMYTYNSETWLFVMNEDYEIEHVLDVISNQYVYGENAVDSDKYKCFINDIGLSQDDLNEFAKLYYQKNIDDVKSRSMEE